MSVQFGRWNFEGKPVDRNYLEKVNSVIAPYGPDDNGTYAKTSITILYRAFHTTKESRRETQPQITESGAVITWDGRLDNRAELIRSLRDILSISSTDVSIVAAAYEFWGSDCLPRLIGDWALSIWDPHTRSLTLAKDPIGTRHLYYSFDKDQVTWSTILDPLALFGEKTFTLSREYIAGWFSSFPAAHLTPYIGIHSVPPSSCVLVRAGGQLVRKYWEFDRDKQVRYRTDAEYEEHFRAVFSEAVRRRLRSDAPVLGELSGGMDSSSIVCMADSLVARGTAETPRLDTVSYYNDSEPDWNERLYFTKVEERRGRTGCHIDVSSPESFKLNSGNDRFMATPGSGGARVSKAGRHFIDCIASQKTRVVLSGIGGDEVMGGMPTPTAELADLLATCRLRLLAHQLKVWALNKRKPWFHLLFETVRKFLPPVIIGVPRNMRPAPWLYSSFVRQNRPALVGYPSRVKVFGALPSFQQSVSTLEALGRQLACSVLPSEPLYEKRYPYLDRCLLEFVFGIPHEQLVRPGQRRSLMRRALAGIVPDEVLNRKRKGFVARASIVAISTDWESLMELGQHMVSSSLGIVDHKALSEALEKARQGMEVPMVPLIRTLAVESWLRAVRDRGVLNVNTWIIAQGVSPFGAGKVVSDPVP